MIKFLVVAVILENGRIKTDLCTKNTDKYQHLPATSCHPNSVKQAIPYGLSVRVKRICSSDKDYKSRRKEIKTHLQNRGYRSSLIEEQLQKVDELNREDLLQYKDRKENDRVPLVFTYSKALPNIHAILRKHLKILHQSNRLKKIFSDPPIVSLKTWQQHKGYISCGKREISSDFRLQTSAFTLRSSNFRFRNRYFRIFSIIGSGIFTPNKNCSAHESRWLCEYSN